MTQFREPNRSMKLNRREAIKTLAVGVGAGAGMSFSEKLGFSKPAASKVTFPKGSIIRTILKDVTPESLGGGATLFHEHITINDPVPSWLPPRKNAPPPAYGGKLDLMVEEVNALAKDGVSC